MSSEEDNNHDYHQQQEGHSGGEEEYADGDDQYQQSGEEAHGETFQQHFEDENEYLESDQKIQQNQITTHQAQNQYQNNQQQQHRQLPQNASRTADEDQHHISLNSQKIVQNAFHHHPRSQLYPPQILLHGVQKEQKVVSPSKSSQEVMQHVFDGEAYHNNSQNHNIMSTIAQNLSKISLSGQGQQDNQSSPQNEKNYERKGNKEEGSDENQEGEGQTTTTATTVELDVLDKSYKTFLQRIAGDQAFIDACYEDKIQILLEFTHDESADFRLGSLIFIFELIYNFRESLTASAISSILSQIYNDIQLYYNKQDFYMVYCALEILALVGPHSISFQNIKLLASILIDEALPILQDKAFLALFAFDYPGFYALLDIANKDFNDIPIYLLNKFAQTEEILLSTVIPSLLNDITTGDPKKKIASLCALNRMHALIWKANALPLLVSLLNEGTIDRQLIVSTIRASGEIGEQTLLRILRTTSNSKIKMAITTVLSWRVHRNEQNRMKIGIVPYNMAQHYNVNPGTMCVYQGDLTPLAFVEETEGVQSEDHIEINSRDFLAALQRLLAVKYEKFTGNTSEDQVKNNHNLQRLQQAHFLKEFTLVKLIDPAAIEEYTNNHPDTSGTSKIAAHISPSVIKALCNLLLDSDSQVRETAVSTLGLIGVPEALQAIQPLLKTLSDEDSQVRAMSAWCLGRLGEHGQQQKVAKKLIELLRDNYWKVRTAACVSLGSLGPVIAELAFPPLTKVLRDGSINRVTVCETLVRLGSYGEQILLDLLKATPQSNFKLKTAIIQAFELANVTNPTIDFVIEELFKNSTDSMIDVRRSCLQTLEILRNRAQDSNITYLKSRNVLPLFYFFLQDVSSEIRALALESISSFGPQAELMFIEGLTKDQSPIVRQECAKGLGAMGVQNVRALLFGLRDANETVRKITAQALSNNFTAEQIMEEFGDKQNQLPALLSNIKDILSLPFYIEEKAKRILETLLTAFGESLPQKQIGEGQRQNEEMISFQYKAQMQQQQQQQQQYQQQPRQQQVQVRNKDEMNTSNNSQQQQNNSNRYNQLNSTSNNRQINQNSSKKQSNSAVVVQAQKIPQNIPNMRGGMPTYTHYRPGGNAEFIN